MKSIKWFIPLAVLSVIGFQAKAQTFTKYQSTDASTVYITGTSTLHNWKEEVKQCDASFLANLSGNKTIVIKDVKFKVLIKNFETESSIMTNKTFSALKEKKFPAISFVSDQTTTLSISGNKFSGKVSGNLILAGKTKQVLVTIHGTLENATVSTVSGVYPISMPAYKITPPTALFGTIKAGNEVKVHFNLKFN